MKNIKRVTENIPVYGKKGEVLRTVPVSVELVLDEISGEYVYTPESLEAIDIAIARAAEMLLPQEMKALRERLGKTQEAMSKLLRLGAKTWTRWETGVAIPDPANRQRIRMLQNCSLTIYDLEAESQDDEITWYRSEPSAPTYGWGPNGHQLFVNVRETEVCHDTKAVSVAA